MIGPGINTFQRIRDWGYTVVESPILDFAAVNPAPIRHALDDTGLAVTVSSGLPAGLSLVSAGAATRARTRCWLQSAVGNAASIGGSVPAGPLYLPVGEMPGCRRTAPAWSRAVDEYRVLGSAIRGRGMRVALEALNRFETYFRDSVRHLSRQYRHANIEEEDPAAAFSSLGRHLIHVHLSENHQGIPGAGHVPFPVVARALVNAGYAVVESFASTIPELVRATAMWGDFAGSPDEFARRSFENMQPLFARA